MDDADAFLAIPTPLSQSAIDDLFGDLPPPVLQVAGIERLVQAGATYERLPMLEVVFDRLARTLSTTLRNFTSDNVEASLEGIRSLRFGDYLNAIPLPAMLAVFKAEEWDNGALIFVDSAMVYSVIDVLLGGRRGTAAMRIEGRPHTTIERDIVERLVRLVLGDLSAAFGPLCDVSFTFERLESNPRFASIVRPGNAVVAADLRIDLGDDRGGRMQVVFPYATLEPVRELLLQMFMGEKFGRDSIWERHLAGELMETDVVLEAVLDEMHLPLSQMLALTAGDTIGLDAVPGGELELRCGGLTLFRAEAGRSGRAVAARVTSATKRGRRLENADAGR